MANVFTRQYFSLLTDTGAALLTAGDTGASIWGELVQVSVGAKDFSDSGDTGMQIRIAQIPVNSGDTGRGWNIATIEDIRTAGSFGVVQRQRLGGDTGTSDTGMVSPFVFAGDKVRVKATAGRTLSDSGMAVDLWLYFKS